MRVLVLGGYGAMAQSTVRDLLESKGVEAVGIAGRSEEKAKAFAKVLKDDRAVPTPVDIRERDRLTGAMKGWDVVINSAWYDLNVVITESAIRAGIHYTDLGGLYNETLKQLKLDEKAKDAGVTCLLGMGSTPGTMNVMGIYGAAKLDRISKVKLRSSGAVVKGGEPGVFAPPYAIRTIFDEFQLDCPILRKGKIQLVPARSGLEQMEFGPPVGKVEGYYTIHSELATMPKTIGKGVQEMDFIVAFPPEFRQLISSICWLGLARHEPLALGGVRVDPFDVTSSLIESLPKPKTLELDVDVQRCELIGEKDGHPMTLRYEAWTWPHERWELGGGTVDTGVPPSIAAQWLAKGKVKAKGCVPPEVGLDPVPYFKELSAQGRGIKIVEYAEEQRTLN